MAIRYVHTILRNKKINQLLLRFIVANNHKIAAANDCQTIYLL